LTTQNCQFIYAIILTQVKITLPLGKSFADTAEGRPLNAKVGRDVIEGYFLDYQSELEQKVTYIEML
jgi:hypothetical protein